MSDASNRGGAPEPGQKTQPSQTPKDGAKEPAAASKPPGMPKEIGGPAGPEPTRYGDWERKGRVSDF